MRTRTNSSHSSYSHYFSAIFSANLSASLLGLGLVCLPIYASHAFENSAPHQNENTLTEARQNEVPQKPVPLESEGPQKAKSIDYTDILNWRPNIERQVGLDKLQSIIKQLRAEADAGNHSGCLFDRVDNCFYRNALIKSELQKSGFNLAQSSATIFVKMSDANAVWSSHSAAVIYTDHGPYVFDPDLKDGEEIFTGDMMTPLSDWLKMNWNHGKTITTLAPPEFIAQSDWQDASLFTEHLNLSHHSNVHRDHGEPFWKLLDGKTPSDTLYTKAVHAPTFNQERLDFFAKNCQANKTRTEQTYQNLKDNNKK